MSLSQEQLDAIRVRAQQTTRWCAECDVPPSVADIDRRDLLAEVDRLTADRDALQAKVDAAYEALVATDHELGREAEPSSWHRGGRHVRIAVRRALDGAR